MNRVPSRTSLLLVSAIGLVLQSAAAMAETPAADAGLEEVTVTAQRVSAKLQDVPLSVTALSAPEAILLRKVLKPGLLATFFGIVAIGILLVGWLFNLLLS